MTFRLFSILAILLWSTTGGAQLSFEIPLPSDPGPTPKYVLMYGQWSVSQIYFGQAEPNKPFWNVEVKTFDSLDEVGWYLLGYHYNQGLLLGLWRLPYGDQISVEQWETTRDVPREVTVENYTEKTQHVKVGDEEFKGEPTGKPFATSGTFTVISP